MEYGITKYFDQLRSYWKSENKNTKWVDRILTENKNICDAEKAEKYLQHW